MDVIRERFEPASIYGRGELFRCGNQTAELIHGKSGAWLVVVALGVGFIPLNIHDDVIPPVHLEVGSHEISLLPDLRLSNRGAETIPAIPPHRRRWCIGVEIIDRKSTRL